MAVQTVCVIGAGTMGNGIAQVFASNGFPVCLLDVQQAFVDRGMETVRKSLDKFVQKGKITAEQQQATLGRLRPSLRREDAAEADLVVEAIVEKAEVKRELFAELDRLCPPRTILASNTSSIGITRIAGATRRADRVIGMHFMNPVPLMELVEVIRGLATSNETTTTILDLCRTLGKKPVEVNDAPGFVSNRVLLPMINEAIFALHEGVATAEAIDQVMMLGMNHKMGPLALADFIGLDVCLDILEVLQRELGDDKYRACPLLRKYVAAGWLGKKSGRGFYSYA